MCGILGIKGNVGERDLFEHARDTLKKRGPDDAGTYFSKEEGIALGHRRLSIIDLSSAGHQPFVSEDQRYVLVFNGEIYNYVEIKQELKSSYVFKTKTDTEVLLAAYVVWGDECLEKLNGMFAFAIWDKKTETLFCARDRFGEKPFFYSYEEGRFLFASEIKALLALSVSRKPNEKIIFDYLYHGLYDHTNETFFEKIYSLPGGHYLKIKGESFQIKRYFDIAKSRAENQNLTHEQIKQKFNYLLEESIRLRFRSDVPVGINLSSGLDSNVIYYYSYLVNRLYPNSFSMCLPSEEFDECGIIKDFLTPDQKLHWNTSSISPEEVFPLAEKMNRIQDQPFGGIPTIAYAKLNEKAHDAKTIVLLEGQGLDEILAGYKYYKLEHEKDLSGLKTEDSSLDYSQDMTKLVFPEVLNEDFVQKNQHKISFETPFDSHLLNAQYRDLFYTKLPRVLRFNDHVTMAYGRELRLPYLDHRIVEFCFWLPVSYKMSTEGQKVLMRELVEGLLPPAIYNTQKKSFGAVQTEWFRKFLKKEVLEVVNSASFRSRGYWDIPKLTEKIEEFYAGKGENSFFIWQCINLEMWFRNYID